jgi:hypothetical protein
MSAINDALKCSKEVQEANPETRRVDIHLHPVEPVQKETSRSRLTLPSLTYVCVLFAFLVLGVFLLREMNYRVQVKATPRPQSQPSVATSASSTPAALPETHKPTGRFATHGPASSPAATAAAAAWTKPEPLKLQAVFFNPARPSAIIGGRTVFVGDRVNEFHVTQIQWNSVMLVSKTQTNVLKVLE